jgi:fimbrial chaperone protein
MKLVPDMFRTLLIGVLLLGAQISTARAGAIAVSPVRVQLSAQQSVSAVTVVNNAAEPALVQLELKAWTQPGGVDTMTATSDLIASPPIFQLAPGGRQVVRIGMRRPLDPQRELSYRLFVQEVPGTAFPGATLDVALRLSVPVLVAPKSANAAPSLTWRLQADDSGEVTLSTTNAGNAHARVREFSVLGSGDHVLVPKRQILAYVLAGQTRTWALGKVDGLERGASVALDSTGDPSQSRVPLVIE